MSFPTHIRGRAKADLLDEAATLARAAKGAGRPFTEQEAARVEALMAEVDRIDVEGAKSADLLARMTGHGTGHDGSDDPHATTSKSGSSTYAKSVATALRTAASTVGVKALLSGEVSTEPVITVEMPGTPHRIVDLVPRELDTAPRDDGGVYEYLRQVARENNAAPVADGAAKPVSGYTFAPVNNRFRTIAHMSESYPIRYLQDHASLIRIVDAEMQEGVVAALDAQIAAGTGAGEQFTGLLTTTGVRAVAFQGDQLRSLRRARTVLEDAGETVTGVVMNPADIEALDLLREGADGTSGAFLGDFYERLFGRGSTVAVVGSQHMPVGQALLGNWSQTKLRIRQGEHTLMATQGLDEAGQDLFSRNKFRLRAEGRYSFDVLRPGALAKVALVGV